MLDTRRRGQRQAMVFPPEIRHHRKRQEGSRQSITVSGACRRLGVVFRELESRSIGPAGEERIEPRCRTRIAKAGIVVDQGFLPVHQSKLCAKLRALHRGDSRFLERGKHERASIAKQPVLRKREKTRAKHGAKLPSAELETPRRELAVKPFV